MTGSSDSMNQHPPAPNHYPSSSVAITQRLHGSLATPQPSPSSRASTSMQPNTEPPQGAPQDVLPEEMVEDDRLSEDVSSKTTTQHDKDHLWGWGLYLRLENVGIVARDHLALERTFLSYIRTSLALTSAGVGK
ncbi:hypothetical protein AX16_007480 [Volvariella volvacea WC 439]|nr:hypothetical protein AX16_007480 [Volvariella volvacea WC 439]